MAEDVKVLREAKWKDECEHDDEMMALSMIFIFPALVAVPIILGKRLGHFVAERYRAILEPRT